METIESVSKWAEETFGPSTPKDVLRRALVEVKELLGYDNGTHIPHEIAVEEAADVCITLYRYIHLVDPEAIEKKMAVNRARKWKLKGDGTGQHTTDATTTQQPLLETQ